MASSKFVDPYVSHPPSTNVLAYAICQTPELFLRPRKCLIPPRIVGEFIQNDRSNRILVRIGQFLHLCQGLLHELCHCRVPRFVRIA